MRNFAEHQSQARRQTRTLIWLFVVAVAAVAVSLYGLVGVFTLPADPAHPGSRIWWDGKTAFIAACAALGTIGLGALLKHSALASGGRAVAESVGGTLITSDTRDPEERKLLNVVEEMSIASGVPLPLVYVLDREEGINAFAAGYSVNDAAVAVTRGGLRTLNRAELQGVMAHEFSHILNGDMRISIRLIAAVAGIEAIAGIGRWLLASSLHTGMVLHSRKRENGAPMLMIGIAMLVIGAAGIAFGHLIRAAISRQREYLADASAVQFTRDPSGIANALKKIGGLDAGSRVKASQATELSHLFFGQAQAYAAFGSLLATHPPLTERIRRLEPTFDGTFAATESAEDDTGARGAVAGLSGAGGGRGRISAASLLQRDSAVGAQQVALARTRLEDISPALREAATHPLGAAAIVVLASDLAAAESAAAAEFEVTPALLAEAQRLAPDYARMTAGARLTLIQLACGPLRQLGATQAAMLLRISNAAMLADQRLTPFEVALREVLHEHLGTAVDGAAARRMQFVAYRAVTTHIEVLLSAMAHLGGTGTAAGSAFRDAVKGLPAEVEAAIALRGRAVLEDEALTVAIRQLARASTAIRQGVLEALAAAAVSDGTIGPEEADMIRAIAIIFQLPLPLPEA
jgi:Zn-dependent protease with chaperone function